jgi:PhzF family phenazine biosynthesis protein
MTPHVLRYAAFTCDPSGGNPAGVVLDGTGLDDAAMLAVAADVGYSETAFLTVRPDGELDVRYFSPVAEVPFCGHATIAAAVALAERDAPGRLVLHTAAGRVEVTTQQVDGALSATLTSVSPRVEPLADDDLAEVLAALGWRADELDPALPPRTAFAGAWHPVVAVRDRGTLRRLDYDLPRLGALMAARSWTTVQLVHRREPLAFDARNPFPPGGVVEDPATGAAAAALGAYLRALGLVDPPARVTVSQGEDLGRPSLLLVDVLPGADAPVRVTGTAVPLPAHPAPGGTAVG